MCKFSFLSEIKKMNSSASSPSWAFTLLVQLNEIRKSNYLKKTEMFNFSIIFKGRESCSNMIPQENVVHPCFLADKIISCILHENAAQFATIAPLPYCFLILLQLHSLAYPGTKEHVWLCSFAMSLCSATGGRGERGKVSTCLLCPSSRAPSLTTLLSRVSQAEWGSSGAFFSPTRCLPCYHYLATHLVWQPLWRVMWRSPLSIYIYIFLGNLWRI